jgi:hypothetical protein
MSHLLIDDIGNGMRLKDEACKTSKPIVPKPLEVKIMDRTWYNAQTILPPVDEECIVLDKDGKISFGHIVDKEIAVDYNGWNIPNVVFWMLFMPTMDMKEYYDQ